MLVHVSVCMPVCMQILHVHVFVCMYTHKNIVFVSEFVDGGYVDVYIYVFGALAKYEFLNSCNLGNEACCS